MLPSAPTDGDDARRANPDGVNWFAARLTRMGHAQVGDLQSALRETRARAKPLQRSDPAFMMQGEIVRRRIAAFRRFADLAGRQKGVNMAAAVALDSFLALLQKSRLLTEAQFDAALKQVRKAKAATAEQAADALVAEQVLTRYQANRLLEGRRRGLFIDDYKVLEILGCGGMGYLYRGRNCKPAGRWRSRCWPTGFDLTRAA